MIIAVCLDHSCDVLMCILQVERSFTR